MNINVSAEDLKDDSVFKRLIILAIAPNVIDTSSNTITTYAIAQKMKSIANSVIDELERDNE